MLQPKPEKGCYKKDMKSKGGSQGLCRNAVDHIKKFDIDDSGYWDNTLQLFPKTIWVHAISAPNGIH